MKTALFIMWNGFLLLLIAALILSGIKTMNQTYRITVSHTEWLKHEPGSYDELVKASCVKVEPFGSCSFIPRKHTLIRGK